MWQGYCRGRYPERCFRALDLVPDRRQFAGTMKSRQAKSITAVGLDLRAPRQDHGTSVRPFGVELYKGWQGGAFNGAEFPRPNSSRTIGGIVSSFDRTAIKQPLCQSLCLPDTDGCDSSSVVLTSMEHSSDGACQFASTRRESTECPEPHRTPVPIIYD